MSEKGDSVTKTYYFDYPWELCSDAYMRRFPTHKRLPFLLDSKLISSKLDETGKIETQERICIIDIEVPGFLKKSVGLDTFNFYQVTIIDSKSKKLNMRSINETFKDKLNIIEEIELSQDKDHPDRTLFTQRATLKFLISVPMTSTIQKIILKSYSKNIEKGKLIDMAFIEDVLCEDKWKAYKKKGRKQGPIHKKVPGLYSSSTKYLSNDGTNRVDVDLNQNIIKISSLDILTLVCSLASFLILPQAVCSYLISVNSLLAYHLGMLLMGLYLSLHADRDPQKSYMFLIASTLDLEELGLDGMINVDAQLKWKLIPYFILLLLPEIFNYGEGVNSATAYTIGYFLSLILITLHSILFGDYYKNLKIAMVHSKIEAVSKTSEDDMERLSNYPYAQNSIVAESDSSSNLSDLRNISLDSSRSESSRIASPASSAIQELDASKQLSSSYFNSSSKSPNRITSNKPKSTRTKLLKFATRNRKNHRFPAVRYFSSLQHSNEIIGNASTDVESTIDSDYDVIADESAVSGTSSPSDIMSNDNFLHLSPEEEEKMTKNLIKNRTLNESLFTMLSSKFGTSTKDLKLSIPSFQLRMVHGEYYLLYLIQLQWQTDTIDSPLFLDFSVEKVYKEFFNLSKSLQRLKTNSIATSTLGTSTTNNSSNLSTFINEIPDLDLIPLPNNKDKAVYSAILEARRTSLESYLQKLLSPSALSAVNESKCNVQGRAVTLLIDFLSYHSMTEFDILKEPTTIVNPRSIIDGPNTFVRPSLTGFVSVAAWRHHWIDYRYILSGSSMMFCKGATSKSCKMNIEIDRILKVELHNKDFGNSEGFYSNASFVTFHVDCLDKMQYTLAFHAGFDIFLDYLKKNLRSSALDSTGIELNVEKIFNPLSGYSHSLLGGSNANCSSSILKKNSLVLNKRKIVLQTLSELRNQSSKIKFDPCLYSRDILQEILVLYNIFVANNRILSSELAKSVIEFSIKVSIFATLSSYTLNTLLKTESQRLVFWTNIYHTLLLHAYLELGPPGSSDLSDSSLIIGNTSAAPISTPNSDRYLSLKKFSGMASYDIAGYLFSLLNIEFSILRAPMSGPLVIPGHSFISSKLTDFRLSAKDPRRKLAPLFRPEPRLNFLLTWGSKSSSNILWVFDPSLDVDYQLSHASYHYLLDHFQIISSRSETSIKTALILPRICQWYSRDFQQTKDKRHLVKYLIPYLPKTLKHKLLVAGILTTTVPNPDNDVAPKSTNSAPKATSGNVEYICTESSISNHSIDASNEYGPVEDNSGNSKSFSSPSVYHLSHSVKIKFAEFDWTITGDFNEGHSWQNNNCKIE